MADARQADLLAAGVEHLDGLGIRLQLVVLQPRAAHAEIVVALLLYLHEVVLRGYARVKADEHALLWRNRYAASCGQRVHHGRQRVRVGSVARKDA